MTTSRTSPLQRSSLLLALSAASILLALARPTSAALQAASATPTSVTLTWTAPGDDSTTGTAAVYDIRYSLATITDANWSSATQVTGEPTPAAAGTVQTFDVTGLNPGTTYYLAIKAADDAGNWSGLSNIVAKATLPENTPPANIANLTATASTQNSVTLTWTAPGDDGTTGTATTYDLRYSTSTITDANWAAATQVTSEPSPKAAGNAEAFTVTGLNASTTYYFAIKTADEIPNWSGLSNIASRATTSETVAPAAIANLGASNETATSVTLSWTAPGDDGSTGTATTYDIRYSTALITAANFNSAAQVTGAPAPKVAGSAESFVVTGLASSTMFYFAIKTADEVPNWSAISNVTNRTTLTESTPPAAIANMTAIASGQNSITLIWTAPGDDGSTGTAATYDLRYSTANINATNFASATQVTGEPSPKPAGTPETLTVSGLNLSTTYYFAIKTADEVPNWSTISNIATRATTGDLTPPASIKDLSAITGSSDGELVLSWTAPGDDSVTGTATTFLVRYSTGVMTAANWDAAALYTPPPIPQTAGTPQSLTMRGLVPGQVYYVGMKAVDERANFSGLSNIVSAQAKITIIADNDQEAPLLVAPADGAVVASSRPILAAKNVVGVAVSAYYFEIATDSSFVGLAASGSALPGADTTTWQVEDQLQPGTIYFWRTRADNLAYSPTASFTVQPSTHAYPNPFVMASSPRTTFTELPSGSSLTLMTVAGEPIRTWTNLTGSDIQWDGTNDAGSTVSSGMYLWYVSNSDIKGKLIVVR
ncbi:hypothetical protein C3F09_01035 [candidate division GN15 bacterium]|uniref:Fibronectin type-III domain-containing protein n=1 Tax=candidate division GN15 bacterium TaxID=2072418 RepID=A0A855X4E4_9BACT|nr:MAG: hypothetical protein C3F09_01035 [candidate division GN15 bacterium]